MSYNFSNDVYINRLCAWAPGVTDSAQWNEWSCGKRDISLTGKGPDLSFTEPMFRRRLSQISKMTIQVAHDLLPFSDNAKILFFSFRGELSRQFQVNKMLIEENSISPAAFSLSVFNAPAALAAMALGLKGGYSAIYSGDNSFASGVAAAKAALLGSATEEIVFIYADEEAPQEYDCFFGHPPFAVSFGFLLSKNKGNNAVLSLPDENETPISYLKNIISGGINVSP